MENRSRSRSRSKSRNAIINTNINTNINPNTNINTNTVPARSIPRRGGRWQLSRIHPRDRDTARRQRRENTVPPWIVTWRSRWQL